MAKRLKEERYSHTHKRTEIPNTGMNWKNRAANHIQRRFNPPCSINGRYVAYRFKPSIPPLGCDSGGAGAKIKARHQRVSAKSLCKVIPPRVHQLRQQPIPPSAGLVASGVRSPLTKHSLLFTWPRLTRRASLVRETLCGAYVTFVPITRLYKPDTC